MSTIILDTLDYAEKLKAGGFTEQQAQALTRVNADVIEKQLATKQDVEAHESTIKRDIAESENRLEIRLKELELKIAENNTRIAETKAELVRWVVSVGLLQSTLIVGVLLKVAHLI
jgi:hypothetical protein